MARKRSTATTATVTASTNGGDSLLERIPENLLFEIFLKLEPDTLTTLSALACVSRTLQSSVYKALSSFSSIDLSFWSVSAFSLDSETFDGIIKRFDKIQKITLDCFHLKDSSITSFLGPHVKELILLKCSSLSYKLLARIGEICPNLRVLTLEFTGLFPGIFDLSFTSSLRSCQCLESLKIKLRAGDNNNYSSVLITLYFSLPETVKIISLEPARGLDTIVSLRTFTEPNIRPPVDPNSFIHTLSHLSLVLDFISDDLMYSITHTLPLLVELDLKDRPTSEPAEYLRSQYFSDLGIQSLVSCKHLTNLSLIRSSKYIVTSFKHVTDMGLFLLSEGCRGLESVRFGGFSKVSDAGFASVLNSCNSLKKIEVKNAPLLTDLTFRDVSNAHRSLAEVKLVSCNSITSDAVCEISMCHSLEVLDLVGCRSVADPCLGNVSCLALLTFLNLGGSDVTDSGMAVLGKGNAPISSLSLRGCKRVTDYGIKKLLKSEGKICKNLTSLDLGHMPGITDNAIKIIADVCVGLTELCVRNCFHVTDASVKVLALKGSESKVLRSVDLYNCTALSVESFNFLKKPFFRGLKWIGIGRTRLICGDDRLEEIYRERRWLSICVDGCEVGCHDGWQFHKF